MLVETLFSLAVASGVAIVFGGYTRKIWQRVATAVSNALDRSGR